MGLSAPGVGIHGTPDDASIGYSASHGCIRMHIPDAERLFNHVHVGTPWDTICREAKTLECDLVVLGSHGYSGLDRILGTTAAKVVNHCERSVLVVRALPPAAATAFGDLDAQIDGCLAGLLRTGGTLITANLTHGGTADSVRKTLFEGKTWRSALVDDKGETAISVKL